MEPGSSGKYFILKVLTFRWVARRAESCSCEDLKTNPSTFWKEFLLRKMGLKPSAKVRAASPEDKACQQYDCGDFYTKQRDPVLGPRDWRTTGHGQTHVSSAIWLVSISQASQKRATPCDHAPSRVGGCPCAAPESPLPSPRHQRFWHGTQSPGSCQLQQILEAKKIPSTSF